MSRSPATRAPNLAAARRRGSTARSRQPSASSDRTSAVVAGGLAGRARLVSRSAATLADLDLHELHEHAIAARRDLAGDRRAGERVSVAGQVELRTRLASPAEGQIDLE